MGGIFKKRRVFRNSDLQWIYDYLRREQPDPEAQKARGSAGNAYYVGRCHPNPKRPFAARGSIAYAAWAAGIDNAADGATALPTPETGYEKVAPAVKLTPEEALRAYWAAFCDADWHLIDDDACEDGADLIDIWEANGLVVLDGVDDDELDDALADERGIEPGGSVWRLTPAGRQALQEQGS
jgi:hypothetical protein